jgi:hypothetical protein
MVVQTQVNLSPDELIAKITESVLGMLAPHTSALRDVETKVGTQKHAYTLQEVADRIGYKVCTIRALVKKGRVARNGQLVRLPALEITPGDFRVTPADLDEFLSKFK